VSAAVGASVEFGAYFANWAQYHQPPYKHVASDLAPIVGRVDEMLYSFAYFCPPAGTSPMPYWAKAPYGNCNDANEFQLLSVEKNDQTGIPTMMAYKKGNPSLKVLSSVGGWNFPSAYFSTMVASGAARKKFIASCMQWMDTHGFDGIDLDWEYPCSPPRTNPVKITCSNFRSVSDAGGKCPEDGNNLVKLVQEMRAAFGPNKRITVASQAAKNNWEEMDIVAVSKSIDKFNVMSYDYTVSDIAGSNLTAPNAPLYSPKVGSLGRAAAWSINYTVSG
jgi:chitinase